MIIKKIPKMSNTTNPKIFGLPPNINANIEPKQIIAVANAANFFFIYHHRYMKEEKLYLSFSSFLKEVFS